MSNRYDRKREKVESYLLLWNDDAHIIKKYEQVIGKLGCDNCRSKYRNDACDNRGWGKGISLPDEKICKRWDISKETLRQYKLDKFGTEPKCCNCYRLESNRHPDPEGYYRDSCAKGDVTWTTHDHVCDLHQSKAEREIEKQQEAEAAEQKKAEETQKHAAKMAQLGIKRVS